MWLYFGMITAGLGAGWGHGVSCVLPCGAAPPESRPRSHSRRRAVVVASGLALAHGCRAGVGPVLPEALARLAERGADAGGIAAASQGGHVLALSVAASIGGVGLVGWLTCYWGSRWRAWWLT